MVEAKAAIVGRRVRGEQSRVARQRHEFAAKILGGTVRSLPLIGLQRDDRVTDEVARAPLQVLEFRREGEVHGAGAFPIASPSPCEIGGGVSQSSLPRLEGLSREADQALKGRGRKSVLHQKARPCAISWVNSRMPVPIALSDSYRGSVVAPVRQRWPSCRKITANLY